MVLKSLQELKIINWFNHLNINQPVHIVTVNDVISPFEGNTNTGDPTWLKIYLQATKETGKETNNIDI